MYSPQNGTYLFDVIKRIIYTKQGTTFTCGGNFVTVSGTPSQQLLASTNQTLGYGNGQMLAYAAGNGTGIYAGLTAGALVNFDPDSTDTGQAVWNTGIICDDSLTGFLDIEETYDGVVLYATAKQNWVIIQDFLYAGGTPTTDVAKVKTAIEGLGIQSQVMNQQNGVARAVIFAY